MSSSLSFLRRYYSAFDSRLDVMVLRTTSLSLKQRSVIIKCCQAQCVPADPASTLFKLVDADPFFIHPKSGPDGVLFSLNDLMIGVRDIIESPASHIILDIMRSVPLSKQEVDMARIASWSKEISVLEAEFKGHNIQWDNLFTSSDSIIPSILPDAPPGLNRLISFSLDKWVTQESNKIHYPRATTKQTSYSTIRSLEDHLGYTLPGSGNVSQVTLEQYYMRTGYQAQGETEIRQKWYRANAKPRTYFCQGGRVYFLASPLQDSFSRLHDMFPYTHRKLRLLPTRLIVKPGARLRIYDFETFTSRFEPQESFVRHLAKRARGKPFYYWDAHFGLMCIDFGELLDLYADECTRNTTVSYERVIKDDKSTHVSHLAGLLGIFGNLMTCTTAHGIVIRYLCSDDAELNVAGDDGVYPEEDEDDELRKESALAQLGRCEKTKTFSTDESEGVIHLKRPFKLLGSLIVHGQTLLFPSASRLMYLYDLNMEDYRYNEFDTLETWNMTRIQRAGRELFRFLQHVWMRQDLCGEQDLQGVFNLARWVTRMFGQPEYGRFDDLYHYWPVVPHEVESFYEISPLERMLNTHYHGVLEAPDYGSALFEDYEMLYAGFSFTSKMSPHLSWLSRLGLLQKTPMTRLLQGTEGYAFAMNYLQNDFVGLYQMYEFLVLEDIPVHLQP